MNWFTQIVQRITGRNSGESGVRPGGDGTQQGEIRPPTPVEETAGSVSPAPTEAEHPVPDTLDAPAPTEAEHPVPDTLDAPAHQWSSLDADHLRKEHDADEARLHHQGRPWGPF